MKHSGTGILWYLAENFKLENNGLENLEALYATACLLMIELLSEETHVEFASFILHLQVFCQSLLPLLTMSISYWSVCCRRLLHQKTSCQPVIGIISILLYFL